MKLAGGAEWYGSGSGARRWCNVAEVMVGVEEGGSGAGWWG